MYKYCPGCGAGNENGGGTMKALGSVRVQAGIGYMDRHEGDSLGAHLICTGCGTQVVEWSTDTDEQDERDQAVALVGVQNGRICALAIQKRAFAVAAGKSCAEITFPDACATDHQAWWDKIVPDLKMRCGLSPIRGYADFEGALRSTRDLIAANWGQS